MTKNLPVELLKLGDKFEFISDRAESSKPAILIVTRAPAVNTNANSCHFRYHADEVSADPHATWAENQSWNGSPGILVRVLENQSEHEPSPDVAAVPVAKVGKVVKKIAKKPRKK